MCFSTRCRWRSFRFVNWGLKILVAHVAFAATEVDIVGRLLCRHAFVFVPTAKIVQPTSGLNQFRRACRVRMKNEKMSNMHTWLIWKSLSLTALSPALLSSPLFFRIFTCPHLLCFAAFTTKHSCPLPPHCILDHFLKIAFLTTFSTKHSWPLSQQSIHDHFHHVAFLTTSSIFFTSHSKPLFPHFIQNYFSTMHSKPPSPQCILNHLCIAFLTTWSTYHP